MKTNNFKVSTKDIQGFWIFQKNHNPKNEESQAIEFKEPGTWHYYTQSTKNMNPGSIAAEGIYQIRHNKLTLFNEKEINLNAPKYPTLQAEITGLKPPNLSIKGHLQPNHPEQTNTHHLIKSTIEQFIQINYNAQNTHHKTKTIQIVLLTALITTAINQLIQKLL